MKMGTQLLGKGRRAVEVRGIAGLRNQTWATRRVKPFDFCG